MILWMQRVLALLLIMAVCFSWGVRTGQVPAHRRPDYAKMDPAQLSAVAEAIAERIAQMEDELALVGRIQQEKLAQ